MPILSDDSPWDDYQDCQDEDSKTIRKINRLLKSILRDGRPMGKAERLKYSAPGVCSARIDESNRLVYKVDGDTVLVISCRGHYSD